MVEKQVDNNIDEILRLIHNGIKKTSALASSVCSEHLAATAIGNSGQ
jgi:hypothetical protein